MRAQDLKTRLHGGVTTRSRVRRGNYRPLKILKSTRLPSDVFGEILEMHPLFSTKLTNATIRRAVRDYINSRSRAVVTKLFRACVTRTVNGTGHTYKK